MGKEEKGGEKEGGREEGGEKEMEGRRGKRETQVSYVNSHVKKFYA